MEFTFGLQLLTSRWGRPDVVICVSPPLIAAAMSAVRARLSWRRPAIGIVVQDLYTRGVAETKAASGLPARAIRLMDSSAIRLADGVSVIHTGFADDLSSHLGVDIRRIREIRNWTHIKPPDPDASAAFREAHHWNTDDVVVMHAGNMGYKQGLENVVAAARLAYRQNSRARFVLIGDGNQRTGLEAAAADVPRLEILPPVSDEEFPAALGAADVLLVNERPGVARMAVPSKLTSYFSAGKPILAATDETGFAATELAASGAGVCVPADRPDLLLIEAVRLGTDPELSRQLGDAGLRYCSDLLSQQAALDRYEQWITDLAEVRTARNPAGRVMVKRALITGITGQDGSYLAEFLLNKGYEVHGVIRRASTFNTHRIQHLYVDPHVTDVRLLLHYGDLLDGPRLSALLAEIQPDEIYHLACRGWSTAGWPRVGGCR